MRIIALITLVLIVLGIFCLTAVSYAQAKSNPEETSVSAERTPDTKSANDWLRTLGLAIGAALSVGLCAIGTGYAQAKIGSAGMGALAEKPELAGPVIISIAIPETAVVLGFVIATMVILLVK